MTTIELGKPELTIKKLIELAKKDVLVLRSEAGERFVLAPAPVDDFDLEVESLSKNQVFMDWLDEVSIEPATFSLEDVEKELGLV